MCFYTLKASITSWTAPGTNISSNDRTGLLAFLLFMSTLAKTFLKAPSAWTQPSSGASRTTNWWPIRIVIGTALKYIGSSSKLSQWATAYNRPLPWLSTVVEERGWCSAGILFQTLHQVVTKMSCSRRMGVFSPSRQRQTQHTELKSFYLWS